MTPKKGNDKVDRRDFINGVLIAAGAAAVGGSLPMQRTMGERLFLVTGRSAAIREPCVAAICPRFSTLRTG